MKQIKCFSLAILLSLSIITSSGLATILSSKVSAITASSSMDMTTRARSYFYFYALQSCFTLSSHQLYDDTKITNQHANSGLWFQETHDFKNVLTAAPSYLNSESEGEQGCNVILTEAATLWGYPAIAGKSGSLMCRLMENAGTTRNGGTDGDGCEGSNDYDGKNFLYDLTDDLKAVIQTDIYSGNDLSLNSAGWYSMYLTTFSKACSGQVEDSSTRDGATDSYNITIAMPDGTTQTKTWMGRSKDEAHYVWNSDDYILMPMSMTCSQIADKISENATAAAIYAKVNPGEAETVAGSNMTQEVSDNPTDKTCGSEVADNGWILCPLINGITSLDDFMWGWISSLLNVNPLHQSDAIYKAWGTIRSIANIVFVIFFLIIIFSQLTSAGITNYGIKKLLPRLVVCAILVNTSFIIVQIVVDLANIIGSSLYSVLITMSDSVEISWSSAIEVILSGTGVLVGGITLAHGVSAAFWMLLPMALMGLLGLLAAILTLIFRQAVIPILAILAPLAFVAYLLPNTESWFKKWKDMMMSMLMLYPMAALVFGGSRFAAGVITAGNGDDFWYTIIGLVVLTAPAFSLPFLAKQGGPLLSKVGGALNGLANKASAPIKDWTKSHQDLAKAKYLSEKPTSRNPIRRTGQFLNNSRMTRERDTKSYKDKAQDNWNDRAEKNPLGRENQAYLRSRAFSPSDAKLESNWDALKTGRVAPGSDLARAANKIGVTQQQLVDSANKQQAYAQSSAISKNIHAENYAKGIQSNADLKTTAVGVDTNYGPARVDAAAQNTIDEIRNKNVSSAKALLSSQNYGGKELAEIVSTGKLVDKVTDATDEQKEAAMQSVMEAGNYEDIETIINSVAAINTATPEGKQLQARFGDIIAKSSNRPKYFGGSSIDEAKTGKLTMNVGQLMAKTLNNKKMSAENIATMDKDEMIQWSKYLSSPAGRASVPSDDLLEFKNVIAKAMGDDRLNKNFSKIKIEQLQAILRI